MSAGERLQRCANCDGLTGKTTEDAIFLGEYGPLCEECVDRLTASAPEMLEVLEWLVEEFDRRDLGDGAMFCGSDIEQVRAAIRKARGEE